MLRFQNLKENAKVLDLKNDRIFVKVNFKKNVKGLKFKEKIRKF